MANKKYLSDIEYENWVKYKKPGCSNLTRCKVNNVSLQQGTSKTHQLKMLRVCSDLIREEHKFITEAVPCKNNKLRHDIVDITNNNIIEIEVTGKLKSYANISYIYENYAWKKIVKR